MTETDPILQAISRFAKGAGIFILGLALGAFIDLGDPNPPPTYVLIGLPIMGVVIYLMGWVSDDS